MSKLTMLVQGVWQNLLKIEPEKKEKERETKKKKNLKKKQNKNKKKTSRKMKFTLCIFFYLRMKMGKKNFCKIWQFQHKRFEGGGGENHGDFVFFTLTHFMNTS